MSTLSPINFGAIDHPDADNLAAVRRCLYASAATGLPVVDYRSWGIGGSMDINIPAGTVQIGHLKLRQLQPNAPDRRTFMLRGGVRLETTRLIIDRGTDGTAGAINDAAALWITEGKGHNISGFECFGGSKGQAFVAVNTRDVTLDRPYLHDLWFDEPAADNDRLQAVWFQGVDYGKIISPRISGLTGNVPNRPLWRTRGIAVGECYHLSIDDPTIDRCDQAIDLTGSRNRMVGINGGHINDVASWGIKQANSALYCMASGTIISNAGLSGCVASGPSHLEHPGTTGALFDNITVINPGGDPRGLAVGFLNLEGSGDGALYPRRTMFRNCRAYDLRPVKIMTHGFYNRVPGTQRPFNCESIGHKVAAEWGFA